MAQTPDLLRLSAVLQKTGLSKSHLYHLESKGKFPKRVVVSERITAWPSDEVNAWVNERIAERINQKPKERPKKKAPHEHQSEAA